MNIGIDWDGTADRYGEAIGKIALLCRNKVIITLNNKILKSDIPAMLCPAVSDYILEVMPESEFKTSNIYEDIAKWKHSMCLKHNIDVMIDDDPYNVDYLESRGISCIKCDGEFENKNRKKVI